MLEKMWLAMLRWWVRPEHDDEGAMSAEYAVATIAAVSFAALLIAVIASPEVREALFGIIRDALGQR